MIYEYWLACLNCISASKKRLLRKQLKTAKTLFYIEETQLKSLDLLSKNECKELIANRNFSYWLKAKEKSLNTTTIHICKQLISESINSSQKSPDEYCWSSWYQILLNKKISFIPYFSKQYPEKLRHIHDAPYALYVLGTLPNPLIPSISIIGSRKCTPYGENYALLYGEYLGKSGIQVISGMARGIDSLGQRGCLNQNGNSYAVLGCGVDICYPKSNQGLYEDLKQHGGLISEFIIGTQPLSSHFPSRNRIISGLSDAVLVIEAAKKSGSLITADMALEQGIDIFALPGPLYSPLSEGCHELIHQGAGILISPETLLEDLSLSAKLNLSKKQTVPPNLTDIEHLIYQTLTLFPKSIDELAKETNLLAKDILTNMIGLELQGYAKESSKGYYVKNVKH